MGHISELVRRRRAGCIEVNLSHIRQVGLSTTHCHCMAQEQFRIESKERMVQCIEMQRTPRGYRFGDSAIRVVVTPSDTLMPLVQFRFGSRGPPDCGVSPPYHPPWSRRPRRLHRPWRGVELWKPNSWSCLADKASSRVNWTSSAPKSGHLRRS